MHKPLSNKELQNILNKKDNNKEVVIYFANNMYDIIDVVHDEECDRIILYPKLVYTRNEPDPQEPMYG